MGVLQLQTKRSRKLVLLSSKGVLLVGGLPRGNYTTRAPFLFLSRGRFFILTGPAPFFLPLKPHFFNPADPFLFLLITPRFFKSTSTHQIILPFSSKQKILKILTLYYLYFFRFYSDSTLI